MASIDFGHINLGSYRVLTFTFKPNTPNSTPIDPSGGVVVNMTPPGGAKTSYTGSLTHTGPGTYTLGFSATLAGTWTGTVYAPSGTGEDAQPFQIEVDPDQNYP